MNTSTLPTRCNSNATEPAWTRRNLRVAREHRSLLAIPPLEDAIADIEENAACLERADCDILGTPLPELRAVVQRRIMQLARDYTGSLGFGQDLPDREAEPNRIVLSGHQPELFHTGVWIKNFAISQIATATNAVPINLVVDNDLAGSRGIKVPRGNRDSVTTQFVEFDETPTATATAIAWEETQLANAGVFASFADRVSAAMSDWSIQPILRDAWPDAVRHLHATNDLVASLTYVRARVERDFGLHNLELPLSRVCGEPAFFQFLAHILAHLPRFRDVHDTVLAEFRDANNIRSKSRPIPDLEERNGWLEAPFWIWTSENKLRRPLFVREINGRLELGDGRSTLATLSSPHDDTEACIQQLADLATHGIKIRTRALTTTLFSRLLVGDLFVHGIGGSKYDEVTDRIIWRFFEIPPPSYATISATLHLPLATPYAVTETDCLELEHQLRDVDWNADRHLKPDDTPHPVNELVAEKRRLIEEQSAARIAKDADRTANWRINLARKTRFQQVNAALQPFTESARQSLADRLNVARKQLAADTILKDREFSFCLFPKEALQSCADLLRNTDRRNNIERGSCSFPKCGGEQTT